MQVNDFHKMMYFRLARRINASERLRSQATKLGNGYHSVPHAKCNIQQHT